MIDIIAPKPVDKYKVRPILDDLAKEVGDRYIDAAFFAISGDEVTLYSPYPGVFIGRAGERITRYENRLKEIGASKLRIVEVEDIRMPDYNYAYGDEW